MSWNSDAKREIGYWIDRTYWGRGVATGELTAFLRLEQTRPLYGGVAKRSAGSIRVLQKCRFTFLGSASAASDGSHDSHFLRVLIDG